MILVLNMLLQPIYCGVIRLLELQSYRSILLINNPLVIYEESHILFLFNFLYNLFFYTDRVYCFVTKEMLQGYIIGTKGWLLILNHTIYTNKFVILYILFF